MTLGNSETGQDWSQAPAGCDWLLSVLSGSNKAAYLATPVVMESPSVPAFVQSASASSVGVQSTVDVTLGDTPTQGNLLILVGTGDGNFNTPISGWTAINTGVNWPSVAGWYKIAGASESATVTITMDFASSLTGIFAEFSGIVTTSPFDQTAYSSITPPSDVSPISAGTTPSTVQANELLIAMFSLVDGSGLSSGSTGLSNSFTKQVDVFGTDTVGAVLGYRVASSVGAYTSAASTSVAQYGSGLMATFKGSGTGGGSSYVNSYAYVDSTWVHHTCEVSLPVVADRAGLTFRYIDENNNWLFVASSSAGVYQVIKVVAGVETLVSTLGIGPVAGDRIKVTAKDAALTFFVNDVQRLSLVGQTDSQTGTCIGLVGQASTSARYDNFQGWQESGGGTPGVTTPGAPTAVVATRGSNQATVVWNAPSNTGSTPIIDYTVTTSPGGATSTVASPGLSTVVSGLTNGSTYTFTVAARNSAGTGASSAPSNAVVPSTVPLAPTGVVATVGNAESTISWSAPGNGGSAITGYTVTSSTGAVRSFGVVTSAVFTGLTNGVTYTFTVKALNANGASAASAPSNSVTPIANLAVPSAPTNVVAVSGNGQATISWSAPSNSGSSSIIDYTVTGSPGGTSTVGAGSPWWLPAVGVSWQWQLTGTIDTSVDADVYDIDGFDVTASVVSNLQSQGRHVIAYFSAGTYENWRPDAASFPASVLGANVAGWAGEKWLDVRQISILQPIMEARVAIAKAKGFNAIEWDNVDGYTNSPGFPLTGAHQIAYNTMLANITHAAGMSVGLKNDLDQIPQLVDLFDFAINEECFNYDESDALVPFINAGKPVFNAEYVGSTSTFCPLATSLKFSSIFKRLDLDAYRVACPLPPAQPAPPSGGTTTTITGLTNGTSYTFTVKARNSSGSSPSSSPSAPVTPGTVPGAPTGVTATPGNSQATVSWTAPSSGGIGITGYTVTSSPGGNVATSGTTTAVVTGLSNGTAYTFTVVATNVLGTGPASSPSNSVVPVSGGPSGGSLLSRIVSMGTADIQLSHPSDSRPIMAFNEAHPHGTPSSYTQYDGPFPDPAPSSGYTYAGGWFTVSHDEAFGNDWPGNGNSRMALRNFQAWELLSNNTWRLFSDAANYFDAYNWNETFEASAGGSGSTWITESDGSHSVKPALISGAHGAVHGWTGTEPRTPGHLGVLIVADVRVVKDNAGGADDRAFWASRYLVCLGADYWQSPGVSNTQAVFGRYVFAPGDGTWRTITATNLTQQQIAATTLPASIQVYG